MKNSEIHTGLEKKEIRDFLTMTLETIGQKSFQKVTIPFDSQKNKEDPFEWSIKNAEQDILFWQHTLQILKEKSSIYQIIKMMGWNEFDVSEETEKDLPYWMCFIGTDVEHRELIKSIKKEKK